MRGFSDQRVEVVALLYYSLEQNQVVLAGAEGVEPLLVLFVALSLHLEEEEEEEEELLFLLS